MATIDELVERLEHLEKKLDRYEVEGKQTAAKINEVNNLLAALKGHAQLADRRPSNEHDRSLVGIVLEIIPRILDVVQTIPLKSEIGPEDEVFTSLEANPGDFRILLVDDEEMICTVLYDLLAKAGYNVDNTVCGKDAIALCGEKNYDLIFMDFWLGDMDGVTAMRQIRDRLPGARVVFMTGDPSINEIQGIVQKEGADGFITKPFDLQDILAAVSRILQVAPA